MSPSVVQRKLRVSRAPRKEELARAVWQALLHYEGEGATAAELAKALRIPVRTVQWHLRNLLRLGEISLKVRGLYVARPQVFDVTADRAGELGVHGLVLALFNLTAHPLGGSRIAREVMEHGKRAPDGSLYRVEGWGDRPVRFAYFPTTDTLRVDFPAVEEPIPAEDLPKLEGWFDGTFGYPVGKLLKVLQIGVQVDHRYLTLDGVKSITFQEVRGIVHRLYQKRKNVVRHEVHFNAEAPGITDLRSGVRIVVEGSPAAQMLAAARLELKLLREKVKAEREAAGRESRAQAPVAPVPPLKDLHESGYG